MVALVAREQRRFALEVVERLRQAGYIAYWAGGCVRDRLLGRTPKDYDVATDALPEQIRELFGRRRTLAIGAAFGVISVIGPKSAGTVEVTTFRRDAAYSDGRHPDSVTFSTAEEDASRRDFTINGLFFDPLEDKVIDFVGGQDDLQKRQIRAIGLAQDRFREDKLRMLRAVRFAATFDFSLDQQTRVAIEQMTAEIHVVSAERIAMEMRRMLTDQGRVNGIRLLVETGLARQIFPEILPASSNDDQLLQDSLAVLGNLGKECCFAVALAALLMNHVSPSTAEQLCRRWRLSNKEISLVVWLVAHHDALRHVQSMPWSRLQPLLVAQEIEPLLTLMEARSPVDAEAAAYCRRLLAQPRETLDPPPLVTGNDLLARGIAAGPQYRELLQRLRAAQLDNVVRTKEEALALAESWAETSQQA